MIAQMTSGIGAFLFMIWPALFAGLLAIVAIFSRLISRRRGAGIVLAGLAILLGGLAMIGFVMLSDGDWTVIALGIFAVPVALGLITLLGCSIRRQEPCGFEVVRSVKAGSAEE